MRLILWTTYYAAAFSAHAFAAPVDFSPIVTPVVQALGIVASVTALPAMWYAVNWIRAKVGLAAIDKDNAVRVAVDAGLQKSVGSGISRVQDAVAGLPMKVDTKNAVINQAAAYAQDTMLETLKAAGLDDPTKLANAIEARLGIMEMQASTGSSSPGIASAASSGVRPEVVALAQSAK
jgi:hypothetical protein